ncbi:MAG: hypothetical protein IJV49_03940 [Aeriscardovia sp.]|nr:hypothetical protein [Aeriscardovia sp.]
MHRVSEGVIAIVASVVLCIGLAACGNADSGSSAPTSQSNGMAKYSGDTVMSTAFRQGNHIWLLSGVPNPDAVINQAFYFHDGKVTVFQYVGDDDLTYKQIEDKPDDQAIQTLYKSDRAGWDKCYPDTKYAVPKATDYTFRLYTSSSKDGDSSVEALIDPSVLDPIDGALSMIQATQNEGVTPAGDTLDLPLADIKAVDRNSQLGTLHNNFHVGDQRYAGYVNWNVVLDNVKQGITLGHETVYPNKEYLVTKVTSDTATFSLDPADTKAPDVVRHGTIDLAASLSKNNVNAQ